MKTYFITDPECGHICDDARLMIQEHIEAGEIEELEVAEALRRGIELSNPQGVPFLIHCSEATGDPFGKVFFHYKGDQLEFSTAPSLIELKKEAEEEHAEADQ
ncbi:hypothetical protein ES703_06157 [subsurface metagenome]